MLTAAGTKYDMLKMVVSGIKPTSTGTGFIEIDSYEVHDTVDSTFKIPITVTN
jgi:hypothetical protein